MEGTMNIFASAHGLSYLRQSLSIHSLQIANKDGQSVTLTGLFCNTCEFLAILPALIHTDQVAFWLQS